MCIYIYIYISMLLSVQKEDSHDKDAPKEDGRLPYAFSSTHPPSYNLKPDKCTTASKDPQHKDASSRDNALLQSANNVTGDKPSIAPKWRCLK